MAFRGQWRRFSHWMEVGRQAEDTLCSSENAACSPFLGGKGACTVVPRAGWLGFPPLAV